MEIDVSVVVPCHRRPGMLRESLAWWRKQTHPHRRFELVFVDDSGPGHYQPQREAVADGAGDLQVKYLVTGLPADVYGVTVARNLGTRVADGPVVLYTDDDCLPHPDLVAQHWASHEHDQALMLVGSRSSERGMLTAALPLPMDREKCRRELAASRDGRLGAGGFKSNNASVRRAHVDAVGGFNEALARRGEYGYTDRELAMRLLGFGCRLRMNPDAGVYCFPTAPELAAAREAGGARQRAHRRFKRIQRHFRRRQWVTRTLGRVGVARPLFPWPETTRLSDAIELDPRGCRLSGRWPGADQKSYEIPL